MAKTDTKINKVYLNVITHWPRAVVNHRGTPGWSRAPVDPPRPKGVSGPVTSGVHLIDRQVGDARSVRMAPRIILSCPTSLWPRDSDTDTPPPGLSAMLSARRWVSGAISGRPSVTKEAYRSSEASGYP